MYQILDIWIILIHITLYVRGCNDFSLFCLCSRDWQQARAFIKGYLKAVNKEFDLFIPFLMLYKKIKIIPLNKSPGHRGFQDQTICLDCVEENIAVIVH